MGIPLIEGRTFTIDDHNRRLGTLIISRSIKDRYWPDASALGKRIAIAGGPAEIVGVVGDVHDAAVDAAPEQVIYKPMLDAAGGGVRAMTVALDAAVDPLSLVPEVRRVIASMDPNLPISDVRSMQSIVGESVSRTRFTMTVLAMGAAVALFLGPVGIYGVIAYGVSQRTSEIGLRQALGADRARVLGLVLRDGIVMAGAGVALGLPLAVGLGLVLSSLLYEVSPYDPTAFVAGPAVLLAAAVLSSAIPAVRASRIEPAACFREQN
jgi:ABC-type antimicrobial peptide transport system permease subunit